MKKIIFLLIIIFLIIPAIHAQNITVLSSSDELESMLEYYYKKAFPNVKLIYSQIATHQFEKKLDPVLKSGKDVPDIFSLDYSFVRKYVESGQLLDLTDVYERNKDKLIKYPVDVGTYKGKVYALSWQVCPGAMFYRRSLARRYLGTDDPKEVQSYFKDFDAFLKTAELLKKESNGKCFVVSSGEDLFNVFISLRSSPWIVNGKLNIDSNMEKYMDIYKTIYSNRYDAGICQWSEGWFEGMKDELRDDKGNRLETFAYFLPPWGLHFILKPNAPETSGDWAMIQGPSHYYWDGTWIGAWKDTKNKTQVKQIIEYLTTNDAFLEAWAIDTGDIVSNLNVINKIKDSFSDSFLNGQNQYEVFAEAIKNVEANLGQETDQIIEEIFMEAAASYAKGKKSKEEAIAGFNTRVQEALSEKGYTISF